MSVMLHLGKHFLSTIPHLGKHSLRVCMFWIPGLGYSAMSLLKAVFFSSFTDEAALFILVLLRQVWGITILSHRWPPTHPLSGYFAIFVALCSNLLIFSQLKYNLYKFKDYIWCTPVSLESRIVTIMCRKYTVDPKGSGINCIPWYPWIQRTLNPVAIVVFTIVRSLYLPGPSSSNPCCQVNCISN